MTSNTDLQSVSQCCILYSTQSGRAKACARRAARIVKEQSILTLVDAPASFDGYIANLSKFAELLRKSDCLLLLFVSTTGDGEHTDSIQRTWKLLLQKSLSSTLFHSVPISLFNLGDRAYGPQFCAAGRKLAVRLLQLGAHLLTEVGYGDDGTPGGGVFVDLDSWLHNKMLTKLGQLGLRRHEPVWFSPIEDVLYSVQIRDRVVDTSASWNVSAFANYYNEFCQSLAPLAAYTFDALTPAPLLGLVTENRRITASDWMQDTRHIQISVDLDNHVHRDVQLFDDSLRPLPYRAGDVAVILPSNDNKQVQRFLDVLPASIQSVADNSLVLSVSESQASTNWPARCTLRGWLKYCADIQGLPEREDLLALSWYCCTTYQSGRDQRDKLIALSESTAAALYNDYILREKRGWADVLYDFDSLRHVDSNLTLEALFGLLQPIRPREFSIASSPSFERHNQQTNSNEMQRDFRVDLCVAVVEGMTPFGRKYHGLCSYHLSRCSARINSAIEKSHVVMWIRPGSFSGLPLDVNLAINRFKTPVLYVGAGTGIAPLRGLIQERQAIKLGVTTEKHHDEGVHQAAESELAEDDVLFFGCRNFDADFYYHEEWDKLSGNGQMAVRTAFSRAQTHKVYVQQILRKAQETQKFVTRHIIQNMGAVYIAGNPKMARAIKDEIVEILAQEEFGGDSKQAQVLLGKLQRLGLFSVEAWGQRLNTDKKMFKCRD